MSSSTGVRVAVASTNRLFCEGIVELLAGERDLVVTGCDMASQPLSALAPTCDVVLLDMQSIGEPTGARAIPDRGAVILVGAPDDDAWAASALSAGARGILTRTATREDVVGAVRVVHGGGIWARRRWLNACVRRMVGDDKRSHATRDLLATRLSRREQEVLVHAATGISNKELAACLAISEATVKVHLTHIFQKLGVSSRAALAATYHPAGSDVAAATGPRAVVRPTA